MELAKQPWLLGCLCGPWAFGISNLRPHSSLQHLFLARRYSWYFCADASRCASEHQLFIFQVSKAAYLPSLEPTRRKGIKQWALWLNVAQTWAVCTTLGASRPCFHCGQVPCLLGVIHHRQECVMPGCRKSKVSDSFPCNHWALTLVCPHWG